MTLEKALQEISALTSFRLANECDCFCPDSPESAGAKFLDSVRDQFVQAVEYAPAQWLTDDEWMDDVHEIADNAPDVYTHTRWAEFLDLGAYNEDLADLGGSQGDMTADAGVALYIIADRLVHRLHELLMESDELEQDEDSDADAEVTA